MMNHAEQLRSSWKHFGETYAPHRAALYRYCRHLTKSPWDAEDLVQDALSRAFVTLAQSKGEEPPNPRAWLFRVASNAWLDHVRRAQVAARMETEAASAAEPDPRDVREAAGLLIGQLSPQERAAVVLKEAFDMSIEETAEVLMTTPGAIKAALHRGRARLQEPVRETAPPALLDAFCKAFAARDLDAVAALLTEKAVVEVVGATTQVGREAAKRTVLWGMMFGAEQVGIAGVRRETPRLEVVTYRGEWVVLSWYAHDDGTEAVRAVNRLELSEDGATRLRNYFYNPEFIADVCEELGLPYRSNGYVYR